MEALRKKYPFLRKRLNPYPSDAEVPEEYTRHLIRESTFTGNVPPKTLFGGQSKGGMDYWGLDTFDPEKAELE
jgi:hypothetical protein